MGGDHSKSIVRKLAGQVWTTPDIEALKKAYNYLTNYARPYLAQTVRRRLLTAEDTSSIPGHFIWNS
jgi:hypothetical protein